MEEPMTGHGLRAIRQSCRWSQKRMAEHLGATQATISELERQNRPLKPKYAEKVSGLSPEETMPSRAPYFMIFLTPKNIKEWRKAQGLTQADLAAMIGRKPSIISKIESGSRPLTYKLSRAIGMALADQDKLKFAQDYQDDPAKPLYGPPWPRLIQMALGDGSTIKARIEIGTATEDDFEKICQIVNYHNKAHESAKNGESNDAYSWAIKAIDAGLGPYDLPQDPRIIAYAKQNGW